MLFPGGPESLHAADAQIDPDTNLWCTPGVADADATPSTPLVHTTFHPEPGCDSATSERTMSSQVRGKNELEEHSGGKGKPLVSSGTAPGALALTCQALAGQRNRP